MSCPIAFLCLKIMKTVDEDFADEVDDVKDAPVLNSLQNNQFLNIDAAYQIIKA